MAPGKVIVKAMALSSDGYKQSLVVTKTFVVQEGGGDEGQMDLNIQKVRSCPPDLEKSLVNDFQPHTCRGRNQGRWEGTGTSQL